jgi:endoglucanase
MLDRLRELIEHPCPPGDDAQYNRWLAERWRPYLQTVEVTPVGNLVGHVGGSGPRVLLLGHSDEIAFTVRAIDERGFIFLDYDQGDASEPTLRGPTFLPLGHPALILGTGGPVAATFAAVTGHLVDPSRQNQTTLTWRDVFVDLGAANQAEVAARGVAVGTPVIWNPPVRQQGSRIIGRAMDNRAALAILETILVTLDRGRLTCDLWVASTAMEEAGTIGAASLQKLVQAHYAIALDVAPAGDIPTIDPLTVPTRLGDGPVIIHKDQVPYTRSLLLAIEHVAQQAGIPFQRAIYDRLGTDAGPMLRQGVAAAALGFPIRYTHSPFETVDAEDLAACARLLQALIVDPSWNDLGIGG